MTLFLFLFFRYNISDAAVAILNATETLDLEPYAADANDTATDATTDAATDATTDAAADAATDAATEAATSAGACRRVAVACADVVPGPERRRRRRQLDADVNDGTTSTASVRRESPSIAQLFDRLNSLLQGSLQFGSSDQWPSLESANEIRSTPSSLWMTRGPLEGPLKTGSHETTSKLTEP